MANLKAERKNNCCLYHKFNKTRLSCILIIEGKNFKVEQFLKTTQLKPYEKHLKGSKRSFKKTGRPIKYEESGCRFDLSKAEINEFATQRKDVIRFLSNNYEKLKSAYDFGLEKTETPVIAFAIENQMADFWCQTEYLEPELLKLAGDLNIGIEISLYHPTLDEDESE